MKIDIDYIRRNSPSTVSPVLVTDMDEDHQAIRKLHTGSISAGEDLFAVDIYE